MLLATVSILGAALVRFPLKFSETGAAIFMLGGTDVLVLGSVVFDTVKHRRLHPAFAIGTLCILVFQLAAVNRVIVSNEAQRLSLRENE